MEVRKVDRETALKFLFGRKFEVERAHILMNNYQKLVREHHFETVTVSDVIDELKTGLMYIPGTRDVNGAALFVIDAGKYQPGRFTVDQLLRLSFFMGNRVIDSPKTQDSGVTIIVDMSGFEWKNFELGMQRQILNMFTNNIPARVKNILLYRAPWWVATMVKVISPFLKEKMRGRIQVCPQGTLERFCKASQLPQSLDGQFAFSFDEMVKQEIDRQGQASFRKERRLDASGKEITKATIIPTGSVIMVSPQTEALLQEERDQLLKILDARLELLKTEVKDINEVMAGPKRNVNALLSKRANRMSIDWVAMHQPLQATQPNAVERGQGKGDGSDEEAHSKEAIKAKIKDRIDRNKVPSPTSTMASSSPHQQTIKSPSPAFELSDSVIEKIKPSPAAEQAKQANAALEEQKDIFKAQLEARVARRIQNAKDAAIEQAKKDQKLMEAKTKEVVSQEAKQDAKEEKKVETKPVALEDIERIEESEEVKRRTIRRRYKEASIFPTMTISPVSGKEEETKEEVKEEEEEEELVDITCQHLDETDEAADEVQDLPTSPGLVPAPRPIRRRRSGARSAIEIRPLRTETATARLSIPRAATPPAAPVVDTKRVSEYDLISALKTIRPLSQGPGQAAAKKAEPIVETPEEEATDVVPDSIASSLRSAVDDGEAKDELRGRKRNTSRRSNRSFVLAPTDSLNIK